MARQPRLTLPGYVHHIIQRGNNRQMLFDTPADYQFMLDALLESSKKFNVSVHAYVLMENHFHLLATPQEADGVPRMMQAVGRRYVRYFNQRQARSGTLWEGRYKSTLIQWETYFLACMAYIDLNPVRAGLVPSAREYPWSSHAHYAGLRQDPLLTPHALYWDLGNTPFSREAAYAKWVDAGLDQALQLELTQAALSGWALGEPKFIAELQDKTTRRVVKASAGRPRIHKAS